MFFNRNVSGGNVFLLVVRDVKENILFFIKLENIENYNSIDEVWIDIVIVEDNLVISIEKD